MLTKSRNITAAATALVALVSTSDLQAGENRYRAWDGYGNRDRTVVVARTTQPVPHRRHQDRFRHGRKQSVVLVHRFDDRVHNEEIPLRRLLGMGSQYNGYRIDNVTLVTASHRNRGRVKLMVDGRPVAGQRLHRQRVTHLTPDHRAILGRNANRVKLRVRGKTFIRSIRVTLKRPAHRHVHRPQPKHRPAPVRVERHSPDPVWRLVNRVLREVAAAQ